ncbi:MAG: hypothetical protein ACRCU2_15675 [Planktothrix sp.]
MHYSTKHYSCRDVPWRVSTKSLQTHYPLPITHYPLPITCSLFPIP